MATIDPDEPRHDDPLTQLPEGATEYAAGCMKWLLYLVFVVTFLWLIYAASHLN